MQDIIKDIISSKRATEAEYRLLQLHVHEPQDTHQAKHLQRCLELKQRLDRIDTWLSLLPDDEAFVIRRHLIDGIDIPRITIEYQERWGNEFGKTERTIKTYQQRALKRIAAFESRTNNYLETSTSASHDSF